MKYILDVDTGIDDALALAYILGKTEDLLGVTHVFGNVNVDQATNNSAYVLELLGKSSLNVFTGVSHAFNDTSYAQKRGGRIFHGENGFANLSVPKYLNPREDAVAFLVASARTYGKDLTIIATGPLSNIAKALEVDPVAMQSIALLSIMGGALMVKGNVSPFAEANFAQDALAANQVLSSEIPIMIVGLDITLRTLLTRDDIQHWQTLGQKGAIFYQLVDYYLKAHEVIAPNLKGCALHDPLAVGVVFDIDSVKTVELALCVLQDGEQAGRVVLDQEAMNTNKKRNVRVVVDINIEAFKAEFMKILNRVLCE